MLNAGAPCSSQSEGKDSDTSDRFNQQIGNVCAAPDPEINAALTAAPKEQQNDPCCAKTLGLAMPQSILLRADEAIRPPAERCGPDRPLLWLGPQLQQGLSYRSGHDVAAAHVDTGGPEGAVRLLGGGGGRDGGT
jgi:hypothetical protein